MNNNRKTELTKEFLKNAKKIEPTDKQLVILAGKNKIYQLRFQKEFFLWRDQSVYRIDNESLKIMKENNIEYDLNFKAALAIQPIYILNEDAFFIRKINNHLAAKTNFY